MRRIFNASTLVFLALLLLVAGWIGSGLIGREPPAVVSAPEARIPTVAASWSQAEEITRELVLYGDVEPSQVAVVRARVGGVVEQVVSEGAEVAEGEVVAQLSTEDRAARLARAEAQLASAQRDFTAAEQLFERDVGSEAELQAARAQLEAARADLRAIEIEIENTGIEAPIGGTVSAVAAERGSYVTAGTEVLEIVDNDPLVAVVHVQQANVTEVEPGMPARVDFPGEETRPGEVQFVAPVADAATRTFRVEVAVDNSGGELPAGLSAEVVIPVETVSAHLLSPALGRLDDEGRLGVLLVTGESRLEFVPVDVIRARADGVWIAGLPDRALVVTISQGTLGGGQLVEVRQTPEEYLGVTQGLIAAPMPGLPDIAVEAPGEDPG